MCRLKFNMEFFLQTSAWNAIFAAFLHIEIGFKVKFGWTELKYYASIVKHMGQESTEKRSHYISQYMMRDQRTFSFPRSRHKALSWLPTNRASEYGIYRIFAFLNSLVSLAFHSMCPGFHWGEIYRAYEKSRCPLVGQMENQCYGVAPAQHNILSQRSIWSWPELLNRTADASWIIHKTMY